MLAALAIGEGQASAQRRDSLVNGAVIGAAVGAGFGVTMNYALRDSDLTVGQYAYGAAVYGAIGAGIGLGVDALFSRSFPRPATTRPRLLFAPAVGRTVVPDFRRTYGLTVNWRW
jgi:RsiW-degrading membrane proteinase PrsW (M82 family)